MKIVFLSNYFNHHQAPLSEELYNLSEGNYCFIETEPIEDERLQMGWGITKKPIYVKQSYNSSDDYNSCLALIDSADVVIFGSAPESFLKNRLKNGKLVMRYTERPLKTGITLRRFPIQLYMWHKNNPKKSNIYVLCASAYTSSDFYILRLFKNKFYKWGYFTDSIKYLNLDNLIKRKKKNSIIWVARFIDWKHPEIAVKLCEMLIKDGYEFEINMIGNGVMLESISRLINEKHLNKYINILGAMKPNEVRYHMEKSELHIFTSDKTEGWGAVLNESMNSACVPIASHAIGSSPFLIEDGVNGFIYEDGNIDDLYQKVKLLLDNKSRMHDMSLKAHYTIVDMWSPNIAAQRFIKLAEAILNNEQTEIYNEGPCSKADIIFDNWYVKNNLKRK